MFILARAQHGDTASTVVVNPTRCPGLKRQISMGIFPTATARSLPTVRLCHTYSHRELHLRCTRRLCLLNIPHPHLPPDITMGCTQCHHVRLLHRFRAHYPTPTFLSVIQLVPPRLLLQAQANHQNSWPLRSAATLSHPPRTQIKRRRRLPTFRTGRSQLASAQSHHSPTASRALLVPSIQNLEASTNTRQTFTHIRDASRSKLSPSSRSRLLTIVLSSVLDHFSNLGIEGHNTASPTDSANRSPEQVHTSKNAPGVNTVYASPRSNTSNGDSPHPPTEPVRFLLTSELASALSPNPDRPVPYVSDQMFSTHGDQY